VITVRHLKGYGIMQRHVLVVMLIGAAALVACGDDDAAKTTDAGLVMGVCDLSKCPMPETGSACCTPTALCGTDTTGIGVCVANPGQELPICTLADCEVPPVGDPCCLPNGRCGRDPWANGLQCFANPPEVRVDAGEPLCDLASCPSPEEGIACCLASGNCGVDVLALGFCAKPVDGGTGISTDPPDDPSVTGECPSYLGANNVPVWGCCSKFGVCGTFLYDSCLLAFGTQIPVPANSDEDAGIPGLCTPPVIPAP